MKKFIITFISSIFIIIGLALIYLSLFGYETNRFNHYIFKEVEKVDKNLIINLDKIKIKLDVIKFNLFFSTEKPKISYRKIDLPINSLKIYFDLKKLLKTKVYISRAIIDLNKFKIIDIQNLALTSKPSNIKSYILNNLSKGSIESIIDLSFEENLKLINYTVNGNLIDTNIRLTKKLIIKKTNLNFESSKNFLQINSIKANFQSIPINDGFIDIKKNNDYYAKGSLNFSILSNSQKIKELMQNISNSKILNNNIEIKGDATSDFSINLDKTLKVLNYNIDINCEIDKSKIKFNNEIKSSFFKKNIKNISLKKSNLKINLNNEKNNFFFIDGSYSVNNSEYQKFNITNNFNKKNSNFILDLYIKENISIPLINYEKNNSKIAKIKTKLIFTANEIKISEFLYTEAKNSMKIVNLILNKNLQFRKIQELKLNTFKNNLENNNFKIKFGSKIIVNGSSFDSTNLVNSIKDKKKNNTFDLISKDLEINIDSVNGKFYNTINKFKLIGKIKKGKIIKILSKSEISENKYLDISLREDPKSNRKILEIYSDIPKIILDDFSFFEGIEEGSLLYTNEFDDVNSYSNLTIEKFKVVKAPAFAKLLSLADFKGMLDLLSGEGISFDILEINFSNNKKVLQIKEIIAIGPSISILMEGYIVNKSGLTSLRGTMVPAKSLNTLISKIPVLGDILIPKEVGEGLFGISFKIKGLPEKIKTSVNPIKTLTPRFITKILERKKTN